MDGWPKWYPFMEGSQENALRVGPDPNGAVQEYPQLEICGAWERYVEEGWQQQQRFDNFGYLC